MEFRRTKWYQNDAIEEAKKYIDATEFAKKATSCYQVCLRNGWYSEILKIWKKD